MAGIARATVRQITSLQQLGLVYQSGLGAGANPPRPLLGGTASGYHAAPQIGDQVATLFDESRYPVSVASAVPRDAVLLALAPGESVQLAADGRQIGYAKADGSTLLYTKPSGASITVSAAGAITVTAASGQQIQLNATGGVYANGVHLA